MNTFTDIRADAVQLLFRRLYEQESNMLMFGHDKPWPKYNHMSDLLREVSR